MSLTKLTDVGEISTEGLATISRMSAENEAMTRCSDEVIYGDFIKTHTTSLDINKNTHKDYLTCCIMISGQSYDINNEKICLKNFRTTVPREYIDTISLSVNHSFFDTILYDIYEVYLYHNEISNNVPGYIPFALDKYGIPIHGYTHFSIKIKFHKEIEDKIKDNMYELCYDIHNIVETFTEDAVQYRIYYTSLGYSKQKLVDQYMTPLYNFNNICHMSKFYAVKSKNIMNIGDELVICLVRDNLYFTYKIYVTKVFGNLAVFELPTYINLKYFDKCLYYNPNSEIIETYTFSFQAIIFGNKMTGLAYSMM